MFLKGIPGSLEHKGSAQGASPVGDSRCIGSFEASWTCHGFGAGFSAHGSSDSIQLDLNWVVHARCIC